MPKVKDEPEKLKPYLFHGIDLNYYEGAVKGEANGDCPWCGREGKFNVNIETGQWRCVVCNEGVENGKEFHGGNATTFIRKLHEISFTATKTEDYQSLCDNRRLMYTDTLVRWNLAKSSITSDWLVPCYGEGGGLCQLYRYVRKIEKGKAPRMALFLTPTLGHRLFGLHLYDPAKPDVELCEGIWDGTTLWEFLGNCKLSEGDYVPTANYQASLLASKSVLPIPASQVFFETWLPLFSGKRVTLYTHNDHPRKHPTTGADIPPASLTAMRRIATMLGEAIEPPESISYVAWGEPGYDLARVSGYDLRDLLST